MGGLLKEILLAQKKTCPCECQQLREREKDCEKERGGGTEIERGEFDLQRRC